MSMSTRLVAAAVAVTGCEAHDPPDYTLPIERRIELVDVAHADGRFVAVGDQIAVSLDGETWTFSDLLGDGSLSTVAFGSGRWMAAGDHLVVSDDGGRTWEEAASPSTAPVTGLAFGADLWIAASEDGVFRSVDGESWQQTDLWAYWSSPEVTYALTRFFVYGEGDAIATSYDGSEWALYATEGSMDVHTMIGHRDRIVGTAWLDYCSCGEPGRIRELGILLIDFVLATYDSFDAPYFYNAASSDGFLVGAGRRAVYRTGGMPRDPWTWELVLDGVAYPKAVAASGDGTVVMVGRQIMVSDDHGGSWRNLGPTVVED